MTRLAHCSALLAVLLLAACGSAAPSPSANGAAAPSIAAPSPVPSAARSSAATSPSPSVAPSAAPVTPAVAAMERSIILRIGEHSYPLGQASSEPVDRAALTRSLESIAAEVDRPAAAEIITDADAYTSTITFVRRPGLALDVASAVDSVAAALEDPAAGDTVELQLSPAADQRLAFADLERGLREHATYWRGIAGVYVYDLETGQSASLNANTVFSGASVLKVPIMIYVYSKLGGLSQPQRVWMERMIGESGNYEASKLMAAAVGGWSTDDALVAAGEMTAMLKQLGLEHTYMLVPYEGSAYLRREGRLPEGGPAEEGEAPFTDADPYVRTTPAEMARLFAMLDACAAGSGPLLEQLGDRLNAALCSDMLDWLRLPHDTTRMEAGLPPGVPLAHKGGWTSDMQADVGIVDSPGGRYVAAIWVYRDLEDGYVTGPTSKATPYLADFSHTIYSFYNPEVLP